jgi:multiple sugar transport system ATP-binding protein
MAEIRIERLSKRFRDGTVAVDDLTLTIAAGELFVLLGPSGCGKTTTLRCVAGLERQTSGDILIGDVRANDLEPADRDVAMVFQFYALYPHLTAYDNIAFPLRAQRLGNREVDDRVRRAARLLKIDDVLERRQNGLSGGEQQRVALGRAIVREPQAFLMDEPLTNLDAELREDMRSELKHLQKQLGATMVHVTHDQAEAMSLGDRVGVMSRGRLEQVGTPLEVYRWPATLFVAQFIGSPPMNLFPVELDSGALIGPAGLRLPVAPGMTRGDGVIAGVRPESFELVEPDADGTVACRVVSREALGDETIYLVEAGGTRLCVRMPPTAPFGEADPAGLCCDSGPCPIYDPKSGRLLDVGQPVGVES